MYHTAIVSRKVAGYPINIQLTHEQIKRMSVAQRQERLTWLVREQNIKPKSHYDHLNRQQPIALANKAALALRAMQTELALLKQALTNNTETQTENTPTQFYKTQPISFGEERFTTEQLKDRKAFLENPKAKMTENPIYQAAGKSTNDPIYTQTLSSDDSTEQQKLIALIEKRQNHQNHNDSEKIAGFPTNEMIPTEAICYMSDADITTRMEWLEKTHSVSTNSHNATYATPNTGNSFNAQQDYNNLAEEQTRRHILYDPLPENTRTTFDYALPILKDHTEYSKEQISERMGFLQSNIRNLEQAEYNELRALSNHYFTITDRAYINPSNNNRNNNEIELGRLNLISPTQQTHSSLSKMEKITFYWQALLDWAYTYSRITSRNLYIILPLVAAMISIIAFIDSDGLEEKETQLREMNEDGDILIWQVSLVYFKTLAYYFLPPSMRPDCHDNLVINLKPTDLNTAIPQDAFGETFVYDQGYLQITKARIVGWLQYDLIGDGAILAPAGARTSESPADLYPETAPVVQQRLWLVFYLPLILASSLGLILLSSRLSKQVAQFLFDPFGVTAEVVHTLFRKVLLPALDKTTCHYLQLTDHYTKARIYKLEVYAAHSPQATRFLFGTQLKPWYVLLKNLHDLGAHQLAGAFEELEARHKKTAYSSRHTLSETAFADLYGIDTLAQMHGLMTQLVSQYASNAVKDTTIYEVGDNNETFSPILKQLNTFIATLRAKKDNNADNSHYLEQRIAAIQKITHALVEAYRRRIVDLIIEDLKKTQPKEMIKITTTQNAQVNLTAKDTGRHTAWLQHIMVYYPVLFSFALHGHGLTALKTRIYFDCMAPEFKILLSQLSNQQTTLRPIAKETIEALGYFYFGQKPINVKYKPMDHNVTRPAIASNTGEAASDQPEKTNDLYAVTLNSSNRGAKENPAYDPQTLYPPLGLNDPNPEEDGQNQTSAEAAGPFYAICIRNEPFADSNNQYLRLSIYMNQQRSQASAVISATIQGAVIDCSTTDDETGEKQPLLPKKQNAHQLTFEDNYGDTRAVFSIHTNANNDNEYLDVMPTNRRHTSGFGTFFPSALTANQDSMTPIHFIAQPQTQTFILRLLDKGDNADDVQNFKCRHDIQQAIKSKDTTEKLENILFSLACLGNTCHSIEGCYVVGIRLHHYLSRENITCSRQELNQLLVTIGLYKNAIAEPSTHNDKKTELAELIRKNQLQILILLTGDEAQLSSRLQGDTSSAKALLEYAIEKIILPPYFKQTLERRQSLQR